MSYPPNNPNNQGQQPYYQNPQEGVYIYDQNMSVRVTTSNPNPQQPNTYPPNPQQPSTYPPNPQQPNTYPPNPQQPSTYPPNPQQPNTYPPNPQQPSTYPPNPQQPSTYPPNPQQPSTYPPNPQQPSTYPPNPQQPNTYPPNAYPPQNPQEASYPANVKTRHLKIGGKDGRTEWSIYNGKNAHGKPSLGWECKIDIDAHGRVSGSNKNDSHGGLKKVYSGTYVYGLLRLDVEYPETGEKAQYSGKVSSHSGDTASLEFKITHGVKNFKTGDHGKNVGVIHWEDAQTEHSRATWKVKIGGNGSSGHSIYVRRHGLSTNLSVSGWTAELEIDSNGNVSGANAQKKYHGSYRNGWLDLSVDYTSGAQGHYVGPLPRSGYTKLKFDFKVGDNRDFRAGDWGWNVGKVDWSQSPNESLFQHNPVNTWVDDPNSRHTRCSGGQLALSGNRLTKTDGKEWSWTTTNLRMSQGLYLCNIRIENIDCPQNNWKFVAGILAERNIIQPQHYSPFSQGHVINAQGHKLEHWTSGNGHAFTNAIHKGSVLTLMLDFNHPDHPDKACLSYLVDGKNCGIAFQAPRDTYYFTFGLIGVHNTLELLN